MIDTLPKSKTKEIKNVINTEQSKDSGMAVTLIFVLLGLYFKYNIFYFCTIVSLLINMIYPNFYKPFARIWLGLATVLGTFVSKIVLTILFYGLVTPVGFIRRLFGADPMRIKEWKKTKTSVFKVRDHLFTDRDIEKPF